MSRLSQWMAGSLDPVKLARLGMEPDPWQQQVLRSTAPRVFLCCSRQVGKSTTTAVKALHRALYKAGCTVLIISPTDRQSGELFLKVSGFYQALGKPLSPTQENVHTLRLENNSRILSLPASESGIRGFTADLLLVDEGAYVPDELYHSVSPMLAVSGGQLVALGTPAGKRGWFYEASTAGRWDRYVIPASECPRISAEFLAEERDRLGEKVFQAEYCCKFVDAAGAAFSGDDITAIFAARVEDQVTALTVPAPTTPRRSGPVVRGRVRHGAAAAAAPMGNSRCEHRWRPELGARRCVWCGLVEELAC